MTYIYSKRRGLFWTFKKKKTYKKARTGSTPFLKRYIFNEIKKILKLQEGREDTVVRAELQ